MQYKPLSGSLLFGATHGQVSPNYADKDKKGVTLKDATAEQIEAALRKLESENQDN